MTDVQTVRLLIPDRDVANQAFTDEEIEALLALEGDVRRGTALALETIASDTVRTLRVTSDLGLVETGAAASDALLRRAAALRKQAAAAETAADVDGLFDVAEFAIEPFGTEAVLRNAALREAV